jgi:hypothetical protein
LYAGGATAERVDLRARKNLAARCQKRPSRRKSLLASGGKINNGRRPPLCHGVDSTLVSPFVHEEEIGMQDIPAWLEDHYFTDTGNLESSLEQSPGEGSFGFSQGISRRCDNNGRVIPLGDLISRFGGYHGRLAQWVPNDEKVLICVIDRHGTIHKANVKLETLKQFDSLDALVADINAHSGLKVKLKLARALQYKSAYEVYAYE